MTKFRMARFGLACDPRGAQVMLPWQGRILLGDVIGVRYDEACCCIRLTVRHFNGEKWPIEPTALAVNVLERKGESRA